MVCQISSLPIRSACFLTAASEPGCSAFVMKAPEPELPEATASTQAMGPDLTSVMGWGLLLEITRCMDTAGRHSWRLVSKAARQAVYDSTTALAPAPNSGNDLKDSSTSSTTALMPQVVEKCSGLKQLSCRGLQHLSGATRLLQLPPGLAAVDISLTDVTDLSFLTRCSALRRLTAESWCGGSMPEPCQLAAVLAQLPGLTALQLGHTFMHVDTARDVAAVLPGLTSLRELGVGSIGPQAAAALPPALPLLLELRILDLSSCRLGGRALLPPLLQLTRLQQLGLSYNALGADGAAALAPALRQLQLMQAVGLGCNELRDKGVSALAPAIQQLTRLTALDLGGNHFCQAGARALAPALQLLTGLQRLYLSENYVGREGAELLAPALQALTALRDLALSSMALGADGAAALAPALQRLTRLQHLGLLNNSLGPAGLHALLPGIQQLVGLRGLRLACNNLDRESVLLFTAGLGQLFRLQEEAGGHASEGQPELQHKMAQLARMHS